MTTPRLIAGPDPNPVKPSLVLPARACDSHCHIFGPGHVFPYHPNRSYTPPDAGKEALKALHELRSLIHVIDMHQLTKDPERLLSEHSRTDSSPAADSISPLIVHNSVAVIAGPDGNREVAVEDFCTGPGQNVLQEGELLVSLKVPAPKPNFGAHYLRFIPRNEMDIAVVGAGASVELDEDGETIQSARIALCAVAPTPLLVSTAGDSLAGQKISDEAIEQAAQLAKEAAKPISDMRGSAAQRKHLSAVLTRRALEGAIRRAQNGSA